MKKGLILIVLIGALIFLISMSIKQSKEIQLNKQKSRNDGVTSVRDLPKDGNYYIVKGADLHNISGDLLGKRIRARGVVKDTKTDLGGKNLLILVEGDCYYLQVLYDSKRIPDDLRNQILKGGIQEGSTVQVWGTVDEIAPETGFNKSILRYKSCFVKSIDKWSR